MIYLRKLKKEDLMSLWEMAYSQLNSLIQFGNSMMLPIMMIISIFQILKNSNYKNQNPF